MLKMKMCGFQMKEFDITVGDSYELTEGLYEFKVEISGKDFYTYFDFEWETKTVTEERVLIEIHKHLSFLAFQFATFTKKEE